MIPATMLNHAYQRGSARVRVTTAAVAQVASAPA